MPKPLVFIFDEIGDAENACEALVAAGFAPEAITLAARSVNGDLQHHGPAADARIAGRGDDRTPSPTPTPRGVRTITVAHRSSDERELAAAIMEDLGGTSMER